MRRFQISTVLLLGTLSLSLTGCSRNPVAPVMNAPMNDGARSMAGIQADDMPAGIEGGAQTSAQVSLEVNKDGRLTVGRFTLDLHKNSLKVPATITMRVASDDATEVEFEVTPPEANDFKVAPKLFANMSDRPNTNWGTVTMWNWKNEAWEAASGVFANATEQTVVSHLKQLVKTKVGQPDEGDMTSPESERSR